ncbi:MAG TPA: response regulator [Elusimicrobia bacterium]|nr:response regulator [Elusimicrobiota bacterium]
MSGAGASTVLVVDDDKNVCALISAVLAGQGYKTVVAGNGKEALAYLRSSPGRPGLILLDLMMPVMTGWEFRRIQQGDSALAGIPVAIITGLPDMEGKASSIGAVDVLYKPSRVETLTSLVSRFCGRAHVGGK